MKKVIVILLFCTIFISSTFCMELRKRKDIIYSAEPVESQNRKRYAANLKDLDPAKVWLGSKYLVTAHIKTDSYCQFCMAYGISRWGQPSTDGSRRLELPQEHRKSFAADPRVLIVKCTDGSGDSAKALSLHLGFIKS